jgi:MFS family permease
MQTHEVSADRPVGIPKTAVPSYSWYALGVLTVVYILNFLDRQLIYTLFPLLGKEMSFTDTQLAMLGTLPFVIFYTALGIPFGRLADRRSRKVIIAIGLAIWSLFSGLTGFATTFWALFACRLMVGVGEATLGPAALSLLSDYFPPRLRATAQATYSSAIPLGSGLAAFLGGWIGQEYGWRYAFYYLGFPGLVVAVVVFFLREQPRGATDAIGSAAPPSDWRALFRSKPLRYLFAGYALIGLASNNIGIWLTQFYVRVHELTLGQIGAVAGIVSICVGVPAMVLGGVFADRVSRRLPGGRLAFTAITGVLSVPLWLAFLFVDNLSIVVPVNIALYALAIMWVGPATADVTEIAGPSLRGLAIGVFFSIINVTAYAIGSPLIGKISDVLGVATDPQQMRYSLLVCPVTCAMGAVLLWMGRRARQREQT